MQKWVSIAAWLHQKHVRHNDGQDQGDALDTGLPLAAAPAILDGHGRQALDCLGMCSAIKVKNDRFPLYTAQTLNR